jgi:hypothetical protein
MRQGLDREVEEVSRTSENYGTVAELCCAHRLHNCLSHRSISFNELTTAFPPIFGNKLDIIKQNWFAQTRSVMGNVR